MTDTVRLRRLIKENGYTFKFIAKKLGLSTYCLQRKMENKNQFYTEEVLTLCKLLNVQTLEEREVIFFKQKVDFKSTEAS